MSGFSISDLGFAEFSRNVREAGGVRDASEPPAGVTREQLREVAQSFEQILMGMMVESMRKSVGEISVIPQMPGHELYQQMLDREYVNAAGSGRISLGLAEALERQFAHLVVEAEPGSDSPDEAVHPSESTERRVVGG